MFLRHIEFTSRLTGIRTDAVIASNETHESAKSNEEQSSSEIDKQDLDALAQQTTALLESVQRSLRTIEDQQRAINTELARAAVELAMVVAEHVVRRSISVGDYGIEEIVKQAMERVAGQSSVTIYLNPADKQRLERLHTNADQHIFHDWNLQADTSLNRGDCYADASGVGILTTVEQHLTGLRQWLLEGLDDGLPTTDDNSSQSDRSANTIV